MHAAGIMIPARRHSTYLLTAFARGPWCRVYTGGMKIFLVEFEHGGKQYGTEIFADTWSEAEGRLASLAKTGKVYGESVETVSACNCPFALEYSQRM